MTRPQHLYFGGETKICETENPKCQAKAQWIVHYDTDYLFLCGKHYREWIEEGFGDE